MIRLEPLALILGMAVVTYVTRIGLFGIARQVELHPLVRRALEYVPVAILAALVFPAIVAPRGGFESPLSNEYLWASLITAAVLLVTRRGWVAIVLGVGAMILFRTIGA